MESSSTTNVSPRLESHIYWLHKSESFHVRVVGLSVTPQKTIGIAFNNMTELLTVWILNTNWVMFHVASNGNDFPLCCRMEGIKRCVENVEVIGPPPATRSVSRPPTVPDSLQSPHPTRQEADIYSASLAGPNAARLGSTQINDCARRGAFVSSQVAFT